ncbi:MAG: TrpB-like pyridoxal phosphate-dependent enzyme [Candidatus Heimdallarchaeota archaeon]|nr:MAG: TrpB-like pyridoxal phosphate-dependent enzyme [Candidatus Heimdallarchaeota archaeon]
MRKRFELDENELPKKWCNILPELPKPLPPPLSPATNEPLNPKDLEALFPKELINQEISKEPDIAIPNEIREKLQRIRPSPLIRAQSLEEFLKTKVRIYYKYEGERSPTGSHKVNTAIAQAFYNTKEGTRSLTTETGAGQWGSALAYASHLFDLNCKVMMVKASYDQKPHRRTIMELYGAEVHPSPSLITDFGKQLLKLDPQHPGSLGIAISEAILLALKEEQTKYSLGSVLNHVLLHQTIIGLEAIKQFQMAESQKFGPDFVVGCVGGGSNFAGLAYPFIREKIRNGYEMQAIAAESTAASKMSDGDYRYDFGDTANMTPLLKMHTLGSDYIPPPIHAGGLRYHGVAPSLSVLIDTGFVTPLKFEQQKAFEAAEIFAKSEGIIPAPESSHAIAAVIDIAKEYRNDEQTVLFNLSGHGLLDLLGYQKYIARELE